MRIAHTSLGSFAFVVLLPAAAAAQVLAPPTRAADVIARTDPASSTQSLLATLSTFGGYDDNNSSGVDPNDPNAPPMFEPSATNVMFHGHLDYSKSTGGRFIGVDVGGSSTIYGGDSSEIGPATNFGTGINFNTPMGSASRFSLDQRVDYNSLYTVGAFNDLAGESPIGEIPTDASVQGVSELSTLLSMTNVGFNQRLGRRNDVNFQYGYSRHENTGTSEGDANSHRATIDYSRQLKRTTSLTVSYAYSNGEYTPLARAGTSRPLVGHTILSGLDYEKRLSPRRAIHFTFNVGASRTDAVTGDGLDPYAFWAPSAEVHVRVDLARTWSLAGNYGRAVTPLAGLTGEAYVADTVGYALGGNAGPVEIALTGGLSLGEQGSGALVTSDYVSYTQSAQVNIPITRRLDFVVQYNWYRHEVSGDAEVASAVPPTFSRNSVRAGLTVDFPIISTR